MSDRLAISASFSVLIMAVYVLFGANVERVPFGPGAVTHASAPLLDDLTTSASAMLARD